MHTYSHPIAVDAPAIRRGGPVSRQAAAAAARQERAAAALAARQAQRAMAALPQHVVAYLGDGGSGLGSEDGAGGGVSTDDSGGASSSSSEDDSEGEQSSGEDDGEDGVGMVLRPANRLRRSRTQDGDEGGAGPSQGRRAR